MDNTRGRITDSDEPPQHANSLTAEESVPARNEGRYRDSAANYDSDDDYESSNDEDLKNLYKNRPPPSVLLKPKPKHSWFIVKELTKRELGLTFPSGKSAKNNVIFEQKYYGSLHTVKRLKLMHTLDNNTSSSISFNPGGNILAFSSNEKNVIVWDWSKNTILRTINTDHESDILQNKFLPLNDNNQLNIVTCARDGQVNLIQCSPVDGSSITRRRLIRHNAPVFGLYVSPFEPHLVVAAGKNGVVLQADVRTDRSSRILHVKDKGFYVPLYSIHGHPLEPKEFVVSAHDSFIRVYDRRSCSKPLNMYSPSFTKAGRKISFPYATRAIYNSDGSEILASYNDHEMYLFDVNNDCLESSSSKLGFTRRYTGHRNTRFKNVAFFGPRSEYVVCCSNCSNVYIWDKKTEAIVRLLFSHEKNWVDYVEPHPSYPVLASSGSNVNIWMSTKQTDPDQTRIEKAVKKNALKKQTVCVIDDALRSVTASFGQRST